MATIVSNITSTGFELEVQPHIIQDGLVFYLDAENPKSYPGTGNTWFDLTDNNNDATINGATFSTDEFQFDGSNDYLSWGSNFSLDVANGFSFFVCWDLPSQSSGAWNYFLFHDPAGSHKYEFGNYGTNADLFHYKDNISYAGTAMTTPLGNGYAAYAFGTTDNGRSFTSLNGSTRTIKNPGSNSYWATSPTTNMVFSELFRGGGTAFSANVKAILLYDRGLTDAEVYQNNQVFIRRR